MEINRCKFLKRDGVRVYQVKEKVPDLQLCYVRILFLTLYVATVQCQRYTQSVFMNLTILELRRKCCIMSFVIRNCALRPDFLD